VHYCQRHTHIPTEIHMLTQTQAHIIFLGNCWNIFSTSLRATCLCPFRHPHPDFPAPFLALHPPNFDRRLLFCTYYNMHINIFPSAPHFPTHVCECVCGYFIDTNTESPRILVKGHVSTDFSFSPARFYCRLGESLSKSNNHQFWFLFFFFLLLFGKDIVVCWWLDLISNWLLFMSDGDQLPLPLILG